jgi:hypothetical protein
MGYPRNAPSRAAAIRMSPPTHYQAKGFDCLSFPLPDGYGWHEICSRGTAAVSFYFTP